jgi:hypothetical protein
MGYVCYTACPASEVPAGAVWHASERLTPSIVSSPLLRVEYSWGPPSVQPGWKWPGFAGMPWQRTTDTTLPDGDPRKVTYFRQAPVTNLDA